MKKMKIGIFTKDTTQVIHAAKDFQAKLLQSDLASTIIAVNPRPFATVVVMVWFVLPTSNKPATPQTAPERSIVRIITFLTLIPMYLAVFSDSPTTEIS